VCSGDGTVARLQNVTTRSPIMSPTAAWQGYPPTKRESVASSSDTPCILLSIVSASGKKQTIRPATFFRFAAFFRLTAFAFYEKIEKTALTRSHFLDVLYA
jgi:hypothetical protein